MAQSDYRNIKKSQLLKFIERLSRDVPGLEIKRATKHNIKLSHPHALRSYPVPINHPKIADWVVAGVKKWLLSCGACNEEDFDNGLKN